MALQAIVFIGSTPIGDLSSERSATATAPGPDWLSAGWRRWPPVYTAGPPAIAETATNNWCATATPPSPSTILPTPARSNSPDTSAKRWPTLSRWSASSYPRARSRSAPSPAARTRAARSCCCMGFPSRPVNGGHSSTRSGAAGYRCVAPDQRGYSPGARPETVEAYGIDHLVGDVIDLCDQLGAEQVDLVGHDWGAIVAWVMAAQHPERVRTLTAVSVPTPTHSPSLRVAGQRATRDVELHRCLPCPGDAGERMLRGDDGGGIQRMFEHVGLGPEAAAEHAGVQASRAHSRPGSTGTGRHIRPRMRGVPPVAVPDRSSGAPLDPAISREAADGCGQ